MIRSLISRLIVVMIIHRIKLKEEVRVDFIITNFKDISSINIYIIK